MNAELRPAIGPLVVAAPLRAPGCSHCAPDSCRFCDGTYSEDRAMKRLAPAEQRAHITAVADWWAAFNQTSPVRGSQSDRSGT